MKGEGTSRDEVTLSAVSEHPLKGRPCSGGGSRLWLVTLQ